MEERIRPAFGGIPDLFEQFAGGAVLPLLPVEFGERGQALGSSSSTRLTARARVRAWWRRSAAVARSPRPSAAVP